MSVQAVLSLRTADNSITSPALSVAAECICMAKQTDWTDCRF